MAFLFQVDLKPKLRAELSNAQGQQSARWAKRQQKGKERKGRDLLTLPK